MLYSIFQHQYHVVPDITLWHASGGPFSLSELIGPGAPLVIDFRFDEAAADVSHPPLVWQEFQRRLGVAAIRPIIITILGNRTGFGCMLLIQDSSICDASWKLFSVTQSDMSELLAAFDIPEVRGADRRPIPQSYMRAPDEDDWTHVKGSYSAEFLSETWMFINS